LRISTISLGSSPTVGSSRIKTAGSPAEEQELSVGLKNPWGAVIGSDLKCGDYVKSTPSGRLTKWDSTKDSAMDVVGQIYAQDFNSEPWGWMKWVMWDDSQKFQDDVYVNKSGAGNLPSDNGYPFDASYGIGSKEMDGYLSQYTTNPTGIPGLHDGSGNYVGYGKNDTVFADMVLGAVPTGTGDDVVLTYQAKDYAGGNLTKLQNGVAVKIDNVAIDPARITIDYVRGLISIKHAAADAGKVVTATYKAFMYGTPTEWDFKGVIGAFRVLLKK
jgi:hypothetical protein